MNNQRRKRLSDAVALIDEAVDILSAVRDEEQESFDNLPESLQQSDSGQQMEENLNAIESAIDSLEEASSEMGQL